MHVVHALILVKRAAIWLLLQYLYIKAIGYFAMIINHRRKKMIKLGCGFINGNLRVTFTDEKKQKTVVLNPVLTEKEKEELKDFFDDAFATFLTGESEQNHNDKGEK